MGEWKPVRAEVVVFLDELIRWWPKRPDREVGMTGGTSHLEFARDMLAGAGPLVVIDPEDRKQVERLELGLRDAAGWTSYLADQRADALERALREFASPTPVPCRASVNVRINTNYIAASCGEPAGHEGSHRSDNGTSWDASEASDE